jgi:GDP-L-fucose synthase
LSKKRILICGATGFIGRNLVESLSKRDDVDIYGTYLTSEPYDEPRVKLIYADLRNDADVNRVVEGMDVIVQAAATTSGAKEIINLPHYHVTDNAVMNSLIFRAAHIHNVSHVVYFSCTTMYQSSDKPVKETDFDANQEMHPSYFGVGWTKVYIEKMCEFYSSIGNTKYTVIRHSNIYGPYDKYDLERSHVFGATITKVMTAEDGGEIIVWGAGEEERDLLYVSDLVKFVWLVIEKQEQKFQLLNLGCSSTISINDLVRKIVSISGKDVKVTNDLTKPTIATKLCVDITRARALGWSPDVSLDEGIRKTIAWYRENIPM